VTLFHSGEPTAALGHLEAGWAHYNPQQHRRLASLYNRDPGVYGLSYSAHILWILGYPEQARARIQAVLRLAQELAHPFSLAFAYATASLAYQLRREWHAMQAYAEALFALATAHAFPHCEAQGMMWRGWHLVILGRQEEGQRQLQQGLALYRGLGTKFSRWLILLAETCRHTGQRAAGLAAVTEALACEVQDELLYSAELYRLQGELLLQDHPPHAGHTAVAEQAEASFQQALHVARQQQARAWELRAATSLGRLWQRQGRRAEARDVLTPVYGWFTEGFDTADLPEAKALLEELGG
jgi:predicted ATPase